MAMYLHEQSNQEKQGMLRITISNTATEERWTLHGRLVAPWVNELKESWKKSHGTAREQRCIVNLDEVTFIDKSGERVLRYMSKQGARFVASDVYVRHVLDRLRRKSEL
jgi:anti-anti-sigma regulatory factor